MKTKFHLFSFLFLLTFALEAQDPMVIGEEQVQETRTYRSALNSIQYPIKDDLIFFFPNPAMEGEALHIYKSIAITAAVSAKFKIYNLKGEVLYQQEIRSWGQESIIISGDEIPKGVTILSCFIEGQFVSKKILRF